MMADQRNPSTHPDAPEDAVPPAELIRPRNGLRTGDALGTEGISDPSGGGKVADPFITIAEKISPQSKS
jgi:hypothetical protein